METKIEITHMSVKDMDTLGKDLKGVWRLECITGKKKEDDRVFLVKDELWLREQDVSEVI